MEQKHTSLFVDGMNLDSHPSLQPPNSYREALNGTLISNNGNHYSFESLEGSTISWSMPEHKVGTDKFVPVGGFRLGDNLFVLSTDDDSATGGAGEIGIVTFNNAGVGSYSAKYYHEDMLLSQAYMCFGYGLEENSNYHRSYWTDNFNQPRTINTASEVLTTLYGTSDLVIGNTYMVLTDSTGYITYDGVDYGPKQTAGNIFTATIAGGTTYVGTGLSFKVIGYLDPVILDYTPAKAMGSIDFVKYEFGGNLFCGVKMYAYQLSTDDGYESSWSYTLNPIHVGPGNPSAGYQQYQGDGGTVASGKSIVLTIKDIPTIFTKIQVAVIEIGGTEDVITNIEIFWISDVTGSEMTITHSGQEALLPLDLDDLSLRKAVIMRCKDIATLKQRQIIANITEREELDWEPTGATLTPFTYEMPVDEQGLTVNDIAFHTSKANSIGVASGILYPGAHYVVRGGTSIEYPVGSGILYAPDETFIGIVGSRTFTSVGGSIVKGCIRIKNYDKFGGGQSYKVIDLEDEFFDYKSMASHCYLRGYWRQETYRMAALAWDKFGNPYAVRFLDDITMPSQSDASGDFGLIEEYVSGASAFYNLKALGIRVDNLDITAIKDKISGISIVRVPRDETILAQSLVFQTVDRSGGTTTCPISTTVPQEDNWAGSFGTTTPFTWNLLGPEMDFGIYPLPLIGGDELRPVSDMSPLLSAGIDRAKYVLEQSIYSKYYTHNRYDGNNPKVVFSQTIGTNGTVPYQSGAFPYTFVNYDIATGGACPSAAGGTYGSMFNKTAAGCQRTLMLTDEQDFLNSLGTGTGVNGVGINTNRKLLVNYVRPKGASSLYGGSSAVAKANNKYIFTGHYLKIDSAVLADIVDGSGNYILNGLEVFGGDCFVNLYDRVSSMFNDAYNGSTAPTNNGSYSWGVIFPCESKINVALREEDHMCLSGMHESTNGILYHDAPRVLNNESFIYNAAYSSGNNQVQYDAMPVGLRDTARFPYMSRYSEQKFLGEEIDNMRVFLINNFRNADALHGEINNLMVGFDRLFYLQNKGIGYYPVEERETTVGALGQSVQLGVGGVMQRADTMDKFYGNQHQSSLLYGEDFFEWFDMRRKAIVRMSFNGGAIDVSVIKGLQTFFQNVFVIAEPDASNILNLDKPLLGQGVLGVYDPIKKTAYHTFKFSSLEIGKRYDLQRNRDFTIGISSMLGKFVGFFSFAPVIYFEHDSRVYAVKKTRQAIIPSVNYTVGMEVTDSGDSYVCIKDFTTTDPLLPAQQPYASGSIYWVKTSEQDEVHRMFSGDICKFFGIVYPWYISVVVNPLIDGQKSFDAVEAYGNPVGFSDVFCSTETLSGSDENITLSNRNYGFTDGKWNFNLPLAKKQRMVDQYMIIKLQVKNYTTDITTSLNLQKRLVFLKTLFRLRK